MTKNNLEHPSLTSHMELLHPGILEAVLFDGDEAFKNEYTAESFDMISDGLGYAVNVSSFTS